MYQCRLRLRRRTGLACTPAVWRRVRVRARSHCDRSLRAIGARRAAAACWQHSGTATTTRACTWRSMHAAGARRSRATGSSFGMNSRASQRADELAGADPANRARLAQPRQLAGRSWPRVRRRGARFGDGLETDHLNRRPGGREATRCAVRPLRGAQDTSLLNNHPRFRHHRSATRQAFILPRAPRSSSLSSARLAYLPQGWLVRSGQASRGRRTSRPRSRRSAARTGGAAQQQAAQQCLQPKAGRFLWPL